VGTSLGEALRVWRGRVVPAEVGLATYGDRRRVAGLRREEIALLAGVSASYYTRLEQGQSRNASPGVLDAIAAALRLSDAERAHLHALAATGGRRPAPRRPPAERVDPALSDLLAGLGEVPAVVLGRRTDVLAWNPSGHALFGTGLARDARPNMAELVFLDPAQRDLYADWPAKARAVVGNLRLVAGRHPSDVALTDLVGRLSVHSADFARLWADLRVQPCAAAVYEMIHPLTGRITVTQQSLRPLSSPDQTLVTCTAPPGTSSASALALLSLATYAE
jgi:transcriptional regulator with XRE-family HTH domain